jgi:hypothetical protein
VAESGHRYWWCFVSFSRKFLRTTMLLLDEDSVSPTRQPLVLHYIAAHLDVLSKLDMGHMALYTEEERQALAGTWCVGLGQGDFRPHDLKIRRIFPLFVD